MKVVRIILIAIGWLWILLFAIAFLRGYKIPPPEPNANLFGYYLGTAFGLALGPMLLFFAYLMKRKLARRKRRKLVDVLLQDKNIHT